MDASRHGSRHGGEGSRHGGSLSRGNNFSSGLFERASISRDFEGSAHRGFLFSTNFEGSGKSGSLFRRGSHSKPPASSSPVSSQPDSPQGRGRDVKWAIAVAPADPTDLFGSEIPPSIVSEMASEIGISPVSSQPDSPQAHGQDVEWAIAVAPSHDSAADVAAKPEPSEDQGAGGAAEPEPSEDQGAGGDPQDASLFGSLFRQLTPSSANDSSAGRSPPLPPALAPTMAPSLAPAHAVEMVIKTALTMSAPIVGGVLANADSSPLDSPHTHPQEIGTPVKVPKRGQSDETAPGEQTSLRHVYHSEP